MNIRAMVDGLVQAADAASVLIPQAGLISSGVKVGEKLLDIFDTLGDDIPADKQPEAQASRAKLAEVIKAKAKATSSRLRGK